MWWLLKEPFFWWLKTIFFVFFFVLLSCIGDCLERGLAGVTSYTEDRSGTITFVNDIQIINNKIYKQTLLR